MAERTHTTKPESATQPWVQRKGSLRIGTPGDSYEREADHAADAVVSGRGLPGSGLSLSRIPVTQVQREDKPKSDEDKLKEAAQKIGEAFLETEVGKKLKEQAANDPLVKGAKEAGESFIGTLPGKIITGAAAAGAVAALAAAHKELPMQIPEIPLDKITPGLKVQITYEGPVNNPSKAMISFSYTEQVSGDKKPAKSKSDLQREENARMAMDMAKFRAGMSYMPGSPEAKQKEAEDAAVKRAAFGGVGKLPDFGNVKTFPGLEQPPSVLSMQFPTPSYGFKPKPFTLLDEELKLKPKSEASDTTEKEKKKDEGTPVQRKAAGGSASAAAPSLVNNVLAAPGQSLDAGTRGFMESRFGHDFSNVRIHTDERAAQSARSVDALAYTSGANIVFSGGAYSPHSHDGKHLLAHELAHVIQQSGAATASLFVQRRNIFESIGIWLGLREGDFDDSELRAYLNKVSKSGEIEGSYDSDNKARAIVRRWKAGDAKFKLLPKQKVVLINEMLDGPTLGDDEACILDLLELSDKADLRQMLGSGGVSIEWLESDLNGDSRKRLDSFFATRFNGGRDALIKGIVEPIGTAAVGAPVFPYEWAMLKAKLDGAYTVEDLVTEISALAPVSRDQALKDVGRERAERDHTITELEEQLQKEKNPVKQAELKKQIDAAKVARKKMDRILQPLFKNIALSDTAADLTAKTVAPDPAVKADILKAMKPEVKTGLGGIPLPFESLLVGEAKSYEDKLRDSMPSMIQGYYDAMVKDKGPAEHADPAKVHGLPEFERIGKASKDETDDVFGNYYDRAKKPQLKADLPKKRGNIHDLFADTEANLKKMSKTQKRDMARMLLFYFFQSDDDVRKLNHAHNASPKFDAKNKPLNAEAKVLDKLVTEFTKTDKDVTKLNEIDRGWDASAGGGEINIQIFKKDTADEDRDFLWDMFQTLIHEYIHTLVHTNYDKYAQSFGDTSNEYNTLIEGVDSLLDEIVWSNIEPRVNDPKLRDKVEGPAYAKLSPIKVLPASRRRYPSYAEAVKLVNIVGIRNLYVAYFIGEVKKIGA